MAEDIHWSDAETLLLLARLARTAPEGRTLIVATFRQPGEEIQPELAETLAEVGRLEGITRVGLENLSANDVGVFVREATDAEATTELVTGTVGGRCANCQAQLASDQRYCVNCGARRGKPSFPAAPQSAQDESVEVVSEYRSAPRPRGSRSRAALRPS